MGKADLKFKCYFIFVEFKIICIAFETNIKNYYEKVNRHLRV